MADQQPESASERSQGTDHRQMLRRRKVMLGMGLLLGVVVICIAAVLTMLHRLEARNASFQPPMTALERQRLLPQDPVLNATPRLDGMRYRDQVEIKSGEFSPAEPADDEPQDDHSPLSHVLILQAGDLHADAHMDARPARHTQ